MKVINALRLSIALAVLAAPAMAYAHPTSVSAHTHTVSPHVEHTEQPHTRTIPAHYTH